MEEKWDEPWVFSKLVSCVSSASSSVNVPLRARRDVLGMGIGALVDVGNSSANGSMLGVLMGLFGGTQGTTLASSWSGIVVSLGVATPGALFLMRFVGLDELEEPVVCAGLLSLRSSRVMRSSLLVLPLKGTEVAGE